VNIGGNYLNSGRDGRRWGTAHESIVPYQAFVTGDARYFVIGAGNDEHFKQLCTLLNMPELIACADYVTNALRVRNRDALIDILQQK
jgi:succinate--hydroxymethylglutarate CoA-transferase